jgi:hypothetical protein
MTYNPDLGSITHPLMAVRSAAFSRWALTETAPGKVAICGGYDLRSKVSRVTLEGGAHAALPPRPTPPNRSNVDQYVPENYCGKI